MKGELARSSRRFLTTSDPDSAFQSLDARGYALALQAHGRAMDPAEFRAQLFAWMTAAGADTIAAATAAVYAPSRYLPERHALAAALSMSEAPAVAAAGVAVALRPPAIRSAKSALADLEAGGRIFALQAAASLNAQGTTSARAVRRSLARHPSAAVRRAGRG